MNTNEQAPECCPFCGAKGGDLIEGCAREYQCGTYDWPKIPENGHPRESQSFECATAERERLTRERDEARAERDQALMLLGVYKTRSGDLLARVKRLEEAVGSLLPYAEATDDESSEWGPGRWKSEKLKRIIDEARKAKEATT